MVRTFVVNVATRPDSILSSASPEAIGKIVQSALANIHVRNEQERGAPRVEDVTQRLKAEVSVVISEVT